MARALKEQGVSGVVCSPHVNNRPDAKLTRAAIEEEVGKFRNVLKEKGVDLELYPAAEYYLDQPLTTILKENHPLAMINGSIYMLIEFPMLHLPPYLEFSTLDSELDDQELRKLLPFLHLVVAHPERNAEIMRHPDLAERLKSTGAILQVNMGSLTGVYGRGVRRVAEKLLKRRLVDVIATDAHSSARVPEIFDGAEKRIKKLVGEMGYRLLCEENPQAIIEGEAVDQL